MACSICVTCGTQYADTEHPPGHCEICEEERQYVGLDGQKWTTLDELRCGHRKLEQELEPGLTEFETEPKFGIGERAFLLEAPRGNVLWDCIALLDDAAVERIRERDGLSAIAISHPHYYTTMVEWSEAFGDVPIWLHEDDQQWIMRPDDRICLWSGEARALHDGLTLIRCGGHFDGGTVLHWPAGAGGRGAPAQRRRDSGDAGPPLGELHVQLSELHPVERGGGAPLGGAVFAGYLGLRGDGSWHCVGGVGLTARVTPDTARRHAPRE
jgi:hypothetical protein